MSKTPFPGGFCGVLMWQNSIGSNWWTLSNASIFYSAPGRLSCWECSHSKLQILLAHFEKNLRQEVLQVGPTYVTVPWVSSHHLSVFPRLLEPPMKAWRSDVDEKSVEQANKSSSSSYFIMVAMSTGDSLIRAFDLETLGAVFFGWISVKYFKDLTKSLPIWMLGMMIIRSWKVVLTSWQYILIQMKSLFFSVRNFTMDPEVWILKQYNYAVWPRSVVPGKPDGGMWSQSPHPLRWRYGISILDIEDMHRLFSNATSVGKPKGNGGWFSKRPGFGGSNGRFLWLEDGKVIVQSESPS